MTLAHIVASLEARHGGPSRSVRGIATALAGLGQPVDLLTTLPAQASAQREGHLAIETFPRNRPEALCPSSLLRARLETADYSLIHAHGLWLRPLHYAHRAARRLRVPLVISPRGMMTAWAWNHHRARKWLASRWLHPGALAGAQGWHATSPAEADDIRKLGFTQPVCVAPNGIQLPTTADFGAARSFWQTHCPQLTQGRVALFYARFHAKKRVLETIDLWLRQAPADWRLLLVGIPENHTVAELTAYAKTRGGGERVFIYDGTDRPAPYAVANLFLLPSHSENFGQTALEALAHGVPVLATDTTPWSGLNRHEAGACVAWNEFADTLRRLLAEDTTVLHSRGQRGRVWAENEFSWDASARTLLQFYGRLAATSS